MNEELNIKIKDGKIYCNDIDVGLTRDQCVDISIQLGHDHEWIINYYYKNCKCIVRDKVLERILK